MITHEGLSLLPYLLHWVPDRGRKLLDRLLDSGNETMRMIGAWCVFGRGFQDAAYTFEADCFIEEGDVYRRLAADVAAQAIMSEEFRERAEQQLIRFFDKSHEREEDMIAAQ